jgi:DNA invertase Pin-like site-specific DNA recombinase
MKKKFAVIYCRVSTTMQADEGVSLEAQKAKAQAWCIAHDYQIKAIYVDAGISGKKTSNRLELQKALADCGKNDALVVYSLSRLARSTKDTIEISELLSKNKTDLISLQENLDTTTAAGKMMFQMLAVLSEFERNLAAERTSTALQYKKSNGERAGQIPFGYDLADDGVMLIENKEQQKIIQLCKKLHKEKLSIRNIAKQLTNKGYKPQGKVWYPTTVARILAT